MDEIIKQYLEDNYYVIFSTHQSYYCMDKTTNDKMGLKAMELETRLIFGELDTITTLMYVWISSKTKILRDHMEKLEPLYFQGLITLEKINELIIAEQCTQKCT